MMFTETEHFKVLNDCYPDLKWLCFPVKAGQLAFRSPSQ
jgi:hypothetical protein